MMTTGLQEEKPVAGLAGVVLRAWRNRRNIMTRPERTLRVVETLSLGGRKQVHLVCCGDQQFLVGGSVDSVGCIVPVNVTAADVARSA